MSGAVKVFVPRDAAALGVGADETAQAILAEAKRRGVAVALIRNGSRGLLWLEPLVEVEVAGTRYAYGPVAATDVSGLFDAGFTATGAGTSHIRAVNPRDEGGAKRMIARRGMPYVGDDGSTGMLFMAFMRSTADQFDAMLAGAASAKDRLLTGDPGGRPFVTCLEGGYFVVLPRSLLRLL